MKKHIVLDTIQTIKSQSEQEFNSFFELLHHIDSIPNKDKKLSAAFEHFKTVSIKEKGDLIHLIYDKKYVNKNPWNDFLRETRALVVNWKTEEIVLYPFSKFFELDEVKESKQNKVLNRLENAKSTIYTLKVDGSLITSRYLQENGEILTVSTGSFDSPHVHRANVLISRSVWSNLLKEHPYLTFMFEMTLKDLPQNIHYDVDGLTLIGARNMDTFELLTYDQLSAIVHDTEAKLVDIFELSFDEVVKDINSPNFSHEGYILDIDGWKVKLKSTNFILGSRISTNEARTFNTFDIALAENRLDSVENLTNIRYRDNFRALKEFVFDFIKQRETFINDFEKNHVFDSIDKREKAKILNDFKPNFANYYFTLKLSSEKNPKYLAFEEKKFLKSYAKFFNTYAHERFAETFGFAVEDVISKINNDEIKVLESYDSQKGKVYMINTQQFLSDKEKNEIYKAYLNQI